jgi:hypothetical protein
MLEGISLSCIELKLGIELSKSKKSHSNLEWLFLLQPFTKFADKL